MIVDSHAHIFPYLGQVPGALHLRYLQRGVSGNQQPVRRVRDNAVVPHTIWATDDPSPAGYEEVGFRVGRFGRFEWTRDGVDYYKQLMAPSLAENACGADYLVAEMDYAGIDWAVLQNDQFYGDLNDFFAAGVRQYPGRLIGTAHLDEAAVGRGETLEELRRAAGAPGLRGLFYYSRDHWTGADSGNVDDPRFDRFWGEVERLGLVVYWAPDVRPRTGLAGYLDQFRRWRRRQERNPALRAVLVGGLPWAFCDAYAAGLPDEVRALARSGTFWIEICYPIGRGAVEEYPYADSLERVRYLYQECGPAALVWGSDMPNVLRHCTYRQSLDYLRRHADFIPAAEHDLVLGGNLARVFGLAASSAAPTD